MRNSNKKKIILIISGLIFIFSNPVYARRVREVQVQDIDIELPSDHFISIRDICSDYEVNVDGENLDIWSVLTRDERIQIFDTLMFLVSKDTFDFATLDLINIFSLRAETPTIKCAIETTNITGLKTTLEVEISPEGIDRWLQRERYSSNVLLEKLADGGFFTLDDLSMYIEEYMSFHRRPYITSSDYSPDILLTMTEWIMESPAFMLIIQNYLINRI